MRKLARIITTHAFIALFAVSGAYAQDRPAFSRAELDQMLAPVALYPDALLSQILMAATYPLEVVQAARWSRANPGYRGQDAVNAVESMDWDPSVKSLVAFPQVLARMDENIEWTQRLGEAFLIQQSEVMDVVQGLRQRAAAAGHLDSNEQVRIVERDGAYIIEPAHPQVVYVPYYDPAVVYGPWWWPAYPPVYWGPPPGYYAGSFYYPGLYWGSGIRISLGFFFGAFDWHRRHVHVVHVHHYHTSTGRRTATSTALWRHDDRHRRGVPYRYAGYRRDAAQTGAWSGEGRRSFRPSGEPAAQQFSGGTDGAGTPTRGEWRRDGRERRIENMTSSSAAHNQPETAGGSFASGDTARRDGRDRRAGSGEPFAFTRSPSSGASAPASPAAPRANSSPSMNAPEQRRVQPERPAPRAEQPRQQRVEPGERAFRAPEARPARPATAPPAAVRSEPQARPAPEQRFQGGRGAQNFGAAPHPAAAAPAPRMERQAPRAESAARPGRGQERQEPGRGRDRRP
jgi:hypothetical protein